MDSKLALLLGGDHRNLQRSHREILGALGYQLVTPVGNGSLDELIDRLKPDLVLFPPELGVTVSATELQGKHPELTLVELEPVRLVEPTSRTLPVEAPPTAETPRAIPKKATPRGDLTYNLDKALYSRKEAAWSLGISIRSLDTLLASKQIAFRRLGRKVMIPAGEVKRISRQNTYVLGARESS